jgi:hypothetical protein
LRALSENGGKGYKATFANEQLLQRLKDMATDVRTVWPVVTRSTKLTGHLPLRSAVSGRSQGQKEATFSLPLLEVGVWCKSWRETIRTDRALTVPCAIQEDARNKQLAGLYDQYSGKKVGGF